MEKSSQIFINKKLRVGKPSADLETLRSRVMLKLNEIDSERTATEGRPFFRRSAAALAAAATLVILIGGGIWAYHFYQHQIEYMPLEEKHWAAINHAQPVTDESGTFATILHVRGKLGYDVYPSVNGFLLVSGQIEESMGV